MSRLKFQQVVIIIFCTISLGVCMSCEHQNIDLTTPRIEIENKDSIMAFLAKSLNKNKDEIKINEVTKEFYIPDTEFHMKIDEAIELFNAANEYKELFPQ